MSNWYKLDNAAKLFPSVKSKGNSSVYRISFVLKEVVDPNILQQALDQIYDRYPMFTVRLKRGVFWNYLDSNKEKVNITEEVQPPCCDIDPNKNNGYLFDVLYYQHRISLEVFHSLTDGSGALEFMKSLVYYYFLLSGKGIHDEGKILMADSGVTSADVEDSFQNNFRECYLETLSNEKAYHIKGTPFEYFGNNTLHGVLDAKALNLKAKSYGVTLTAYIAALLIYATYQVRLKGSKNNKPIVIALPVNLRKVFPSQTLRNFFGVVNVGAKVDEQMTFEALVARIDTMIKQKTNKEKLQNIIYSNVKLERNSAAQFVPLLIKDKFVHFGFRTRGESRKTMTLSNLGNIQLPTGLIPLIENVETLIYPSKVSPINCGISTINNRLTISFTRKIVETDILQYFFAYLSKQEGLHVKVYSNNWGDGQ